VWIDHCGQQTKHADIHAAVLPLPRVFSTDSELAWSRRWSRLTRLSQPADVSRVIRQQ